MATKPDQKSNFRILIGKDRAILMICIGIALSFWFFTKMAHQYESRIPVKVQYELPEGKVLSSPLPSTIYARFIAGGWDMLLRFLVGYVPEIVIPLDSSGDIISSRLIEILIDSDVRDEYQVVGNSLPDLSYSLDNMSSRRVPLHLDQKISFSAQHILADSIRLVPDSVTISGPQHIIENINSWKTQKLELTELKTNFNKIIPLVQPENSQIKILPGEVNCQIDVEQVTEKTLKIPLKIIGKPDGSEILLFHNNVQVVGVVGLDYYEAFHENDIEAVVNFANVDYTKNTFAPVEIRMQPNYVRRIKVIPDSVEFFISNKK